MSVPAPDQPATAAEAPTPEVTITIADGKDEVSAGQMVRYQVMVHNAGPTETPLTVRLTMPAHSVTSLEASDAAGSAVIANAVAWKNVVPAGETRTYSLVGRVDTGVRARELAVTACVHEKLSAPAVACATDRNELADTSGTVGTVGDAGRATPGDDHGARKLAWIGSIIFGILAVVGALWLYRKVNPEPLTPANGDRTALPGGTPPD